MDIIMTMFQGNANLGLTDTVQIFVLKTSALLGGKGVHTAAVTFDLNVITNLSKASKPAWSYLVYLKQCEVYLGLPVVYL